MREAPLDPQAPLLVEVAHVAGPVPPARGVGPVLRSPPAVIAVAHPGASHDDLAGHAGITCDVIGGHASAIQRRDRNVDSLESSTHEHSPAARGAELIEGDLREWQRLGHAVGSRKCRGGQQSRSPLE